MTATRRGHRALVVEDDRATATVVCTLLEARGDSPRLATTADEALAAMDEETFCYAVFDQHLPFSPEKAPTIAGGECILTTMRGKDPRRAGPFHVTPIVVLTSFSNDEDFIGKMYDLGTSAFMSKPIVRAEERFLDKLRVCLERAGRGQHAQCAGLALAPAGAEAPAAEKATPSAVTLALHGTTAGRGRSAITVNGVPRDLIDSRFAIVLRSVAARDRSVDAWASKEILGVLSRNTTSQIREAFDGLVPEGFQPLESDWRGNLRLNPAIVVEPVDWRALAEHSDPAIAKVARDQVERAEARR